MKDTLEDLRNEYGTVLQRFLRSDASSDSLSEAHGLGQKALSGKVALLEITKLHGEVLSSFLADYDGEERQEKVDRAGKFLESAFTPYEGALRRAHEADALVCSINDRVEQESRRIAHALHDEAGQMLACAQIAFEDFVRSLPCGSCAMLENALLPLEQLEDQLRQIAHELRPMILDDLGLMPALHSLATGVTRRRKLAVSVQGSTGERLPDKVETALYRVTQAALNNVCRHAKATRAEVEVERNSASVRCVIRDDGVGFDVGQALHRGSGGGLGLIGILDRAKAVGGNVRIESAPGRGTEVIVVVPVAAGQEVPPTIGIPASGVAVRAARGNGRKG
jgi:signal transduction histidine kinase